MDTQQQDDLVAQFCAVTGATTASAQSWLDTANWDLQGAMTLYFADQDGPDEDEEMSDDGDAAAPSQPPAQPASSSRKPPTSKPKHMTIDELKKREEGDDEDDSDDDKKQDMYAGGEKSGLAVANPGKGGGPVDHFKNIMNQARQNRERPPAAGDEPGAAGSSASRSSAFTGRAQTLGGDDAESQVVEDPSASQRQQPASLPTVARTLHLWADGVSIDDGPLFRFDDPANQSIMEEINNGRAPLALLDVQPGQEVELSLNPHKDQNYVQPPKKYKPFGGSGQRLGSPTPGPAPTTAAAPAQTQSAPAAAAASAPAAANIDPSRPTIQLQVRLGDGTRLASRFNTTHTIGDVYNFVNAASPASTQRAYALMTTFPSRELSDRAVVLGDMGEFKRGGVVVQKWT